MWDFFYCTTALRDKNDVRLFLKVSASYFRNLNELMISVLNDSSSETVIL